MRTHAIIIKKINAGEYDQQITCYTQEFGKLTAVAKSILKPSSVQSMHLDLFSLVSFELISGRGMPIISTAQAEKTFTNIKSSLSATATAFFVMEVIDRMVFDNQKDDELWENLISTLNRLNDLPHPGLATFRNIQLDLLKILGHAPSIHECVACGEKNSGAWALAPVLGGIICGQCFLSGQKGILLTKSDLALFSGQASITDHSNNSVLDSIFEELANTQFRSLPFLYRQLLPQIL